ncbi:MAG: ATP-binding cassette domain-containing protein [Planctomycetales bacterium]|nr:ATP-binding cassette domain-containing protein [Planctomycetales bacterium]
MIELADLSLHVGQLRLQSVELTVPQGAYGVLMGRTGSGKSTLLECLCGLRVAERGQVRLHGKDVTALPPRERGIGYVPQDGALFATHTVREHLAFSLVVRRWSRCDIERRCAELADWLQLAQLLDRKPVGLSGGERQRIALGRALAFHPRILLLDEPLSAVDEPAREQLYDVLRDVQRRTGATTLHVTHSQAEAAALADCVFQLRDGQVAETRSANTVAFGRPIVEAP